MKRWLLLFCLCTGIARAGQGKFVLVIGSFPEELAAFARLVPAPTLHTSINGVDFAETTYAGHRLLLCVSGMSLVNAATTTQLALDHFPISAVTFTGIAGGVDPNLHPGDVVVPAHWYYHAEGIDARQVGPDKYEPPHALWAKAAHAHYGMFYPMSVIVIRAGQKHFEPKASFPADPGWLAAARKAATGVKLPAVGGRTPRIEVGGAGVSGPVFLDNAGYRAWIYGQWRAHCVDEESAAIAQVCWINRVPCLVVRGLSDLAGGQKGENQEDEFGDAAAADAAAVLAAVIKAR